MSIRQGKLHGPWWRIVLALHRKGQHQKAYYLDRCLREQALLAAGIKLPKWGSN